MNRLEAYVPEDPAEDQASARKAYEELPPDDVIGVIAAELNRLRRAQVHAVERQVITVLVKEKPLEQAREPVKVKFELTPEIRKLMPLRIALGGGEYAKVEEATKEQLEQRIAMMETHVRGTQESVTRLREIVTVLTRTGAKCLKDLLEPEAA